MRCSLCARKVEENEAVRMRCCELGLGGWVVGWVGRFTLLGWNSFWRREDWRELTYQPWWALHTSTEAKRRRKS